MNSQILFLVNKLNEHASLDPKAGDESYNQIRSFFLQRLGTFDLQCKLFFVSVDYELVAKLYYVSFTAVIFFVKLFI